MSNNTETLTMEEIRDYAKRLPTAVLELIQRTAKGLPKAARGDFTRNCIARMKGIVSNHMNTFFYAGLGLVAGELLKHACKVDFFFIHLSPMERADELGALAGGVFGYFQDKKEIEARERMLGVIKDEVRRAKSLPMK
jgi:hypothetical protein